MADSPYALPAGQDPEEDAPPPALNRILIVEDERNLRETLKAGLEDLEYECESAADAHEAMAWLQRRSFSLVLTDLRMPEISGLQLLRQVRVAFPDIAVIIATGTDDRETAVQAMRAGAYDYLVKPFTLDEMEFSVQRAMERLHLAMEVRAYQRELERKVRERSRELEEKNQELQRLILDVISMIAVTLEVRDEYTAHHSYRVAQLSVKLANHLGLDESHLEHIRLAALLHDIGKIGIRESVLHKEGKLTTEEMEHIKTHPLIAEQILRPLKLLEPIIPAIKHEHEAYDGSGYPDGIAGGAIPLEARIISVVDAYDALTSDRPYRSALPHERAIEIMSEGAGRIWDPQLVQLFEQLMAKA